MRLDTMSAATPTTTTATTINERSIDCETRDEVDFVKHNNNSNSNKNQTINNDQQQTKVIENKEQKENNNKAKKQNEKNMETKTIKATTTTTTTTPTPPSTEHKKNSTKERLSLFSFSKKLSHKNQPQQVQANGATTPTSNNNNNNIKNKETGNNDRTTPTTSTQTPFSFACQPPTVPIGTPPRQHRQFVKNSSSSLARLFSSTYNAKKFEKEEEKRLANAKKFHTYGGRRRSNGPYLERFKKASKDDGDAALCTDAEMKKGANSCGDQGTLTRKKRRTSGSCSELATLEPYEERHEDLGVRALRTLSRGLGKLWWKRSHSVEISTPDPEFKVAYLGNVLTGWAKGEGCVEKQLATLWRNYTQNNKPDVIMRIKVCASGLKATTRQHGLTEYWANRITHCCAPKNYPRVFCWIYRHEGRKLKHELRCHAVLCSKEKIVHEICDTLKENLECALRDFKREKILKQNARLSLANAAYDNPSLPRRKILLSVGGNNYRPPLERSKSAPKLMAIEEAIGEEEGEEIEETNEPEMKPCCQRDSLYPAMTLGRRRCRRGHSIRRTGKARPCFGDSSKSCCGSENKLVCESPNVNGMASPSMVIPEEQQNNYGSNDSDDFEKLLKHNNYDSNASLATELLPYFDLQLNKNKSSSLSSLHELKEAIDDDEPLSLLPTINSDPNADPEADFKLNDQVQQSLNVEPAEEDVVVGLRRPGICSDGEDDFLDDADDVDVRYFRQQSILNILHRNSMRKMAQLSLSSDENSSLETHTQTHTAPQYRHQLQSSISSNASSTATTEGSSSVNSGEPQRKQFQPDSDEGSISSGCETASTVTTPNQDDLSLQYCRHSDQQAAEQQFGLNGLPLHANGSDIGNESPVSAEEIYQRLEARLNGRHNSDATTFSSSSSITLKTSNSPSTSAHDLAYDNLEASNKSRAGHVARAVRRLRRASAQCEKHDSDSECSDESGYVEFQEREKRNSKQDLRHKSVVTIPVSPLKPQPPPKPMPRRHIAGNSATANSATAV